jgi:ketosteroid isomerase-like protein
VPTSKDALRDRLARYRQIKLSVVRRTRWQTLGVMLLILASACCLPAQSAPSSNRTQTQEITDLEQRRAAAVVHRDIGLLDTMTAPDSVRILPTGTLETKSQLLSELKSGELTYDSINVDELSVKLYGNTAVVTGRSEFRGQMKGKPFRGHCRFSRVWVKSGSGWQEILFQLTALQEP